MAMDKSSADSFVYAKASGMLAKSYVGLRARDLFAANSLGELWSLLFKKEIPSVPETLLARELEKEAFLTFVNQYKALIQNYSSPQPVLLALLHGYDYENLKDSSITSYQLPSYTAVNNRLKALERNMSNLSAGRSTLELNDGSRRQIVLTNLP